MRDEYRAKLPGKADRIEALVAAGDPAALAGYLHKLGGTAGSYGLAEVADQALAIEGRLEDGAAVAGLESALARLLGLLRAANRPPL
jgi:HPt (histidine-containing phosphotransfer) domain-containing protein